MPIRVVHVCGGRRLPSGIARSLDYLLAAARQDSRVQHAVVDPRGAWPVPLGPWAALVPLHLLAALVRAAGLLASGRANLVHLHVAGGGSTLRKLPFLLLARLLRRRVLIHLHSGRYEQQYAWLPRRQRRLVRWFLGAADRVVVLGPRMHGFVTRQAGVPEARVRILPNAVAGPACRPQRPAQRGGPPRITCVGALLEDKGLGELLAALSGKELRAQAWQLVVVGHGDVGAWSARAAAAGLAGRVRFTGWVSRAEVTAVLAETDLFVLPSRVEGMSLAVLEAMAHGCAIIATQVGEIAAALEDGVEGLVIPPRDPQRLAAALQRLLSEPAERARLGSNARARYERCHSMARHLERLIAIYMELLELDDGHQARD